MKKMLVLTSRFPFPVIGGDRLRIYYLCKELSRNFELTLLSLCETQQEVDMDVSHDNVFTSIHRVILPKWRSYLSCLRYLPTSTPLQVAYYRSTEFRTKLQMLLPAHDLALAHLIRTGDYLVDAKVPKVLEMTDAISLNYQRVSRVAKSSGFKNIVFSIERERLKHYEQNIVEKFDASFLVSQIDKDYLFFEDSPWYKKVLVCTNGVDTESLDYKYYAESKQLVFIGNLNSVQNLDAALWFAKNVMPLLRHHNDFTFKIIGRIKSDDMNKFNNLDGVSLTGSVDSIKEQARNSLAGVCSVRLGAGIQNKILEYMALGIPCVTSKMGLEGLNAIPERDILVANKPEEYVSHILSLYTRHDFARKLAENGRKYVVTSHSWVSQLETAVQFCKELVSDRP